MLKDSESGAESGAGRDGLHGSDTRPPPSEHAPATAPRFQPETRKDRSPAGTTDLCRERKVFADRILNGCLDAVLLSYSRGRQRRTASSAKPTSRVQTGPGSPSPWALVPRRGASMQQRTPTVWQAQSGAQAGHTQSCFRRPPSCGTQAIFLTSPCLSVLICEVGK